MHSQTSGSPSCGAGKPPDHEGHNECGNSFHGRRLHHSLASCNMTLYSATSQLLRLCYNCRLLSHRLGRLHRKVHLPEPFLSTPHKGYHDNLEDKWSVWRNILKASLTPDLHTTLDTLLKWGDIITCDIIITCRYFKEQSFSDDIVPTDCPKTTNKLDWAWCIALEICFHFPFQASPSQNCAKE